MIQKIVITDFTKRNANDQGPDFDGMPSFFPCKIDDAIQYINLGYGAHAQKIDILQCIFSSFCVVFKF